MKFFKSLIVLATLSSSVFASEQCEKELLEYEICNNEIELNIDNIDNICKNYFLPKCQSFYKNTLEKLPSCTSEMDDSFQYRLFYYRVQHAFFCENDIKNCPLIQHLMGNANTDNVFDAVQNNCFYMQCNNYAKYYYEYFIKSGLAKQRNLYEWALKILDYINDESKCPANHDINDAFITTTTTTEKPITTTTIAAITTTTTTTTTENPITTTTTTTKKPITTITTTTTIEKPITTTIATITVEKPITTITTTTTEKPITTTIATITVEKPVATTTTEAGEEPMVTSTTDAEEETITTTEVEEVTITTTEYAEEPVITTEIEEKPIATSTTDAQQDPATTTETGEPDDSDYEDPAITTDIEEPDDSDDSDDSDDEESNDSKKSDTSKKAENSDVEKSNVSNDDATKKQIKATTGTNVTAPRRKCIVIPKKN